MPDTAVLEPGTAAAPEAPPEPAPLETAPDDAPETAALEETPETGGSEPEGEEERSYTAAELKAAADEGAKRERGIHEKWRAAEQEKAQREAQQQQYAANQQRANANRQGFAQQALSSITKAAFENGKDAPDGQAIARVANELNAAQFHEAHVEYGRHLWSSLQEQFPTYRPSQEVAAQAAAASTAYDRAAMVRAQQAMTREAIEQDVAGKATARAEAEVAAKAAAVAKAPAPKKPASGPTAVTGVGGGGRRPSTQQQADVAYMEARQSGDPARAASALAVVKQSRREGWPW